MEQSISDESDVNWHIEAKVMLIGILGVSQEDSECADSDFYSDLEFD